MKRFLKLNEAEIKEAIKQHIGLFPDHVTGEIEFEFECGSCVCEVELVPRKQIDSKILDPAKKSDEIRALRRAR